MDPSMPPPPPQPPRNPNPSSSMPPPPPEESAASKSVASAVEAEGRATASSSSSIPPPPAPSMPPHPEESAASKSDASGVEAEGRATASSSSSIPPPPAPEPAPLTPQPEGATEPAAGADGTANDRPSTSESTAEEAGSPSGASSGDTAKEESAAAAPAEGKTQQPLRVPYDIPEWSSPPPFPFFLEVIKDGVIVDKFDVSKKGAYMFGRSDVCDIVLENPSTSRFHAVLQFRKDGEAYLVDLGSTQGTFVNKTRMEKKKYNKVRVGDVIRFAQSSRLYIFQGPTELTENDMQKLSDAKRNADILQDKLDREASLLRAKTEAALSEGVSWGMAEDAIEDDAEDEADEVTWQTYKGQLTDRQEKTRTKILKRMEKIANMKKEIDAIRVKDITQGGLTQGQQTQIARNEQRISQIMEELDNLEETLNDSIRESIGARSGKAKRVSNKTTLEEEVLSDDDSFFDRTKKRSSSLQSSEPKSVETADSLLEKKDSITTDIENKKKLLEEEKHKLAQSDTSDHGDDLDAYMSGLSSQLVHDKIARIQKELSDLQAELDRVVYLLKIADPMGAAARKRDLTPREVKIEASSGDKMRPESHKHAKVAHTTSREKKEKVKDSCDKTQADEPAKLESDVSKNQENGSKPAFTMPKPQWLGDKRIIKPEENFINEEKTDEEEPDNFVDYKDRKAILSNSGSGKDLEEAGPGLILRKRKAVDQSAASEGDSSSVQSEASAADAVALLLKHKRGLQISDDMVNENERQASKGDGKKSKQKRVLGPARPDFLDKGPDNETWVPPEGQTGDGRTALNDRLGY